MTKPLTILEAMSHDAHQLHTKISANMARSKAETWADVKSMQADTLALAEKMKGMAADQADAVKADINATISKMEAAGKMIESKTGDAVNDIEGVNKVLLESARSAAESLSKAVAELRTRVAQAIAPAPM